MRRRATEQDSIPSERFRIRVLFPPFEFLQSRDLIVLHPSMLGGLSQSAPPDLIQETECPVRMGQRETDETLPSVFFSAGLRIRVG
jgi:hypothetical protein